MLSPAPAIKSRPSPSNNMQALVIQIHASTGAFVLSTRPEDTFVTVTLALVAWPARPQPPVSRLGVHGKRLH